MSALLKYTLARFGLFVLVAGAMLAVPLDISPLLKLMIALAVSAALAFFLLKRLREEASVQAVGAAQRRTEKRERLRAALNGDDDEGESTTKAD
jgi:membrane protein implicated in regulation of membrane protease activity